MVQMHASRSTSPQFMPVTSPPRWAVNSMRRKSGQYGRSSRPSPFQKRLISTSLRTRSRAVSLAGMRTPTVGSFSMRSLATAQRQNVRNRASVRFAWTPAPAFCPLRTRSRCAALSPINSRTSPLATWVNGRSPQRETTSCSRMRPHSFAVLGRRLREQYSATNRLTADATECAARLSATGFAPAAAFAMLARARVRASSTFGTRAKVPSVSMTDLPATRSSPRRFRALGGDP